MLDVAREGDQDWTRPILTETGPKEGKSSGPAALEVHPGGPSSLRYSQGVRTPRFLYVEHATRERELYDVRRDPRQLTNLVDRPAMADVVSQLAQVLDRLRTCSGESCNEPLPPALQDR
jgi:arylsulfatase A-like enzyme